MLPWWRQGRVSIPAFGSFRSHAVGVNCYSCFCQVYSLVFTHLLMSLIHVLMALIFCHGFGSFTHVLVRQGRGHEQIWTLGHANKLGMFATFYTCGEVIHSQDGVNISERFSLLFLHLPCLVIRPRRRSNQNEGCIITITASTRQIEQEYRQNMLLLCVVKQPQEAKN